MSIPFFPFKKATRTFPNNSFPPHIAKDPNVLYHGTSNTNEKTIEKEGIKINTSTFSKKEIEDILTLFDSVKWPNKRFWSENNLRNYSLNHDFKDDKIKPIYLGECAGRVGLYASKEFAGGEICAQVRNVFRDLNKLITDPEELKNELKSIKRAENYTQKKANDYDLGLNELQKELDSKKHYLIKANQSLNDFEHGVIYAIKVEKEDEAYLEYSLQGQMGIKCFRSVPPSRIIAKTKVPPEYVHNDFNRELYSKLPCGQKGGILYMIKNDRGVSLESLDKKTEEILARVKNSEK